MNNNQYDIIKIGGAVITDKYNYRKMNLENLHKIGEAISNWGRQCIIIHGAGSFGHIVADEHSITSGFNKSSQLEGIIQIRLDMQDLTKKVVEVLRENKLPVVSFQTSSIVYINEDNDETSYFFNPIKKSVDLGLLPVLSGDIIFKEKEGFSIFSGDSLINLLVQNFNIKNVFFISNIDGLYVKDSITQDKKLIEKTNYKQLQTLEIADFLDKKPVDVTGAMKGKIRDIISISKFVERVKIINGFFPERIIKALNGEKTIGTVIDGEKST